VAFLFTDIEGSTNLARARPDEYADLLERHRSVLRESFARHEGYEAGTEGDSFFVVFSSPLGALRAAVEAQRELAAHEWPPGADVRVRMGLHVGEAGLREGDYVGLDIHRAARLAAAGHGGQILASGAIVELLADRVPPDLGFRDLGRYRLKDFAVPASIFQVVGEGLERDFPALRTQAISNLPEQLTSFIGRERELADLAGLVERHRLVTLIGTGGSGKTRLMLEAAAQAFDRHPDGTWLVELAPIADPGQVEDEVARTLGVHGEPGKATADGLVDFLRSKSLLLLLDNCEHLVESVADLLIRLLRASPRLMILASSREALGIPGEVVFQVPSLGLPVAVRPVGPHETRGESLEVFAAAEAVRLFVDRATAVLPTFALTPANLDAVVEICRRLDGIPLAIELAAARVTVLSVEEIADKLGDRFRLLTGGRRAAVPRQQTLKALIDWSWDLLAESDKRLLRRLAVFAGGCTLEAAAAVTAPASGAGGGGRRPGPGRDATFSTLEGLDRLVDRSLVVVDRTAPTRYRLLETIRQYAQDRLDETQETAEVRGRHLDFFLQLALQAQPELRGPDMVAWLDRLDAEADNLRLALEWAFEADPDAALRLSSAMTLYWRSRFVGSEEVERLARAADIVLARPAEGPGVTPESAALAARVLAAAAEAAALWGNAMQAQALAEEAVRRARDAEGQEGLAEALSARALAAVFLGEAEGARFGAEEIIQLARSRQDWWLVAMTETGVALSDLSTGGPGPAEARMASATEAARRSGNPFAIAFAAGTRGQLSGLMGRVDEARHWFGEAIQSYERMGDRRFVLMARSDLAHALRRTGATSEAEHLYRETLAAWQHAGTRGAIANQLESFAFLALARENDMRAARLFGAAETVRQAASANMLPHERAEYDAALRTLRERLDAPALENAWAEGRSLSLEEAIAFALSP
jgi:predicted ATPase/class 3 adenylate cyclase